MKKPDKRTALLILYGITFYLIITFIAYPLLNLLVDSLKVGEHFSLDNYITLSQSNADIRAFKNTIKVGIVSTISCMLVGVYLAFQTDFFDNIRRPFIKNMLLFPFVLPGIIIVISDIQLFGELGMFPQMIKMLFGLEKVPFSLGGFWGIIFVHTCTQYIYFYLNTSIALRFFDHNQIESAKNLGASNWQIFSDIILPYLRPALITSALMTFSTSISSFSPPYLIGNGYLTMSIQVLQYKMNNRMSLASATVVTLMCLTFITIFLYQHYQKNAFKSGKAKQYSSRKQKIKSPIIKHLSNVVFVLLFMIIFLPVLNIIYMSMIDTKILMVNPIPTQFTLENYWKVLQSHRILAPIKNSLVMATSSALICTLIAVATSYLLLNKKSLPNKVMGFFVLLPIAIPASTLGVTLILAFNKKNILLMGNSLIGTYWILPIAYIISSIAIVSRSTFTAFSGFNKELEYSSKSLGASHFQTLLYVFLPMVKSGIISGFAICFMRALGDYTISALLYGASNKPISIAMVNALHDFDIGVSMVYGVIVIFIGLSLFALLDLSKLEN